MSVRIAAAKLMILSALLGVTTSQALAAGDPEAGKAGSMVCASCHGQDGASAIDPSYPQLAGQNERYLAKQLKMFQSGERDVALMTAQLVGKSEQDLDDLAAYYASLPSKAAQATGNDDDIALARRIYKGGISEKVLQRAALATDLTVPVMLRPDSQNRRSIRYLHGCATGGLPGRCPPI